MAKRNRKFWVPRFSLRLFLLASVGLTLATAWLAKEYSTYESEQKLIRSLAESTVKGAVKVQTNGNSIYLLGGEFM